MRPRLRALVLSAGLGTRLRPLSDAWPKPLLPVAGASALERTLRELASAGCEAAAINLHHRGELVRRHFGDDFAGMPLVYSEEPRLLGTLGALLPLLDFLAAAEVILVLNGDSLCRWPLTELVERQLAGQSPATLLLASRPRPEEFGGGVGIDGAGRVVSFFTADPPRGPVRRRLAFAGAHALSPSLLSRLPDFPAPPAPPTSTSAPPPSPPPPTPLTPLDIVRDLYIPLLARSGDSLATWITGRRWHDLGTPRRFLAAALDIAGPSGWISPAAHIAAEATVSRAVIETGAEVAPGARVERSVLLPGARCGAGSLVRGAVLAPGAVVAAGASAEAVVVSGGGPGEPVKTSPLPA